MIIEQKKRRIVGHVITVERDPEDMILEPGYRYITSCERHATLCEHKTLKDARAWATYPIWCEECQAIINEKESKVT